jgi:ATP-dependent HslUV protease ATP-binding subunit HslU
MNGTLMNFDSLGPTPKEIVNELDKYIIGQDEAKRAVAIALRNRNRRKLLPPDIREDVIPKNILMIGPTGVGKTEIARRMASIISAPFVKVEATKFTEIGYIGRSVESMIRDLVSVAYSQVKKEFISKNYSKASKSVLEIIYKSLIKANKMLLELDKSEVIEQIKKGIYDEFIIEIEVSQFPKKQQLSMEEIFESGDLSQMLSMDANPFDMLLGQDNKAKKKKVTVAEAKKILSEVESEKYLDHDEVTEEALRRVQEDGIIFIDEIDKLISKGETTGPNVSREGVQRDLLPIVEGTTVNTRYGPVKTDHILFISAGAFSKNSPSDLIAELQGRFPVRVELKPLSKEDLKRILFEPKNALVKQYKLLLSTEGVTLEFDDEAIDKIAEVAYEANQKLENIGARRLYTVMEKLLSDISFEAPDKKGSTFLVTKDYVDEKLKGLVDNQDLAKYIL